MIENCIVGERESKITNVSGAKKAAGRRHGAFYGGATYLRVRRIYAFRQMLMNPQNEVCVTFAISEKDKSSKERTFFLFTFLKIYGRELEQAENSLKLKLPICLA